MVSWISIVVVVGVGSFVGEFWLVRDPLVPPRPEVPLRRCARRCFGIGWAAVTTIPPVRKVVRWW